MSVRAVTQGVNCGCVDIEYDLRHAFQTLEANAANLEANERITKGEYHSLYEEMFKLILKLSCPQCECTRCMGDEMVDTSFYLAEPLER